jgi:hypothetical protein
VKEGKREGKVVVFFKAKRVEFEKGKDQNKSLHLVMSKSHPPPFVFIV